MVLFIVGLMCLARICMVDAQSATLSTVTCENTPCQQSHFRMSFKLSGTPTATASIFVSFRRIGDNNIPPCQINRNSACDPNALCGCTLQGGEKTFHYEISSASSSVHDGDWNAVVQGNNDSDTVRSPICQVKVNTSCQHLVPDQYPESVETLNEFYISFSQKVPFPSTQDATLDFVVNDGSVVTFNLTTDLLNTQPTGCFRRGNDKIYYFNTTALLRYSGSWMAVYKSASAGTIQSNVCQVSVKEPQALPVTEALKHILGIFFGAFCGALITLIFSPLSCMDKRVKLIVLGVGFGITLIFVIALGAYSLGTQRPVIDSYPFLLGAVIALLVIGCLVLLLAIIFIILIARDVRFPCEMNGTRQSTVTNGTTESNANTRKEAKTGQ